jgi:hypothetical protein
MGLKSAYRVGACSNESLFNRQQHYEGENNKIAEEYELHSHVVRALIPHRKLWFAALNVFIASNKLRSSMHLKCTDKSSHL